VFATTAREAHIGQGSGIQELNDLAAVQRVPGEPVGVPSENTVGAAPLDLAEHRVENWAARRLGALRFFFGSYDAKFLPFRVFLQFLHLGLDRQDLMILVLGGFPTIDEILIHEGY